MKSSPFHFTCRWIWLPETSNTVNQYVDFRKTFTLKKKPIQSSVLISADSDCALFINGREIWGRQFSDYPHHRSFNAHEVAALLRPGKNTIAILSYHRGRDSSEYRQGKPGLIFQLKAGDCLVASDSSWLCRLSPAFASGNIPKVTGQMGFTAQYDARRDDDWRETSHQPGKGWTSAIELAGPMDGYWKSLRPRPLPQLLQQPFLGGRLIAEGSFIRPPQTSPHDACGHQPPSFTTPSSPAEAMASSFKRVEHRIQSPTLPEAPMVIQPPPQPRTGAFAIVDLGREETGLLQFTVEAPEGTVMEIAHGEHLDDLGVRALVGGRQFADRYICQKGRNEFTLPFRRLGCRYLEVHFTCFNQPVTLHRLGLLPLSYPVQRKGTFDSPDALLNQTREASIRTLDLCMHEHYEDCPWREQSLYSFDSRNQALYGYYAFGEYDFPAESFRLLGWGQREDGLLELCAPARVCITIPIFSLVWICALRDHFLFSGRPDLFREFKPAAERILSAFLARKDEKTGLCRLFDDKGYWTFYEWAPGLSGKEDGFRLDAPHNLFLIEAIEAYREMHAFAQMPVENDPWAHAASDLRKAVHRTFWNEKAGYYATFADHRRKWHACELTQALAILCGIGTETIRNKLRREFSDKPALVPMTLSSLFYGARVLMGANSAEQIHFANLCRGQFSSMLSRQATSLWETAKGGDDFDYAGSLCHGWSALPVWFAQAYLLGVTPVSPGFSDFRFSPHVAALPWARGTIPTPRGKIKVEWEHTKTDCILNLSIPKSCSPLIQLPADTSLRHRCFINGKKA
ncbi:MAG: family 78 glycoside hydrolase catalytic domain [Verrucomicrobiae bacterium]|nr:family 78 glycoside hydrolase catalytic domain [Verrucomicrobiae bacterium]